MTSAAAREAGGAPKWEVVAKLAVTRTVVTRVGARAGKAKESCDEDQPAAAEREANRAAEERVTAGKV